MSASAFAVANAALFNAFGVPATWRAGGTGPAVSVTVVREIGTVDAAALGVAVRAGAQMVHVRVSEVPNLSKGDTFTIGAETLTVAGAPSRDGLGTMWTAEC